MPCGKRPERRFGLSAISERSSTSTGNARWTASHRCLPGRRSRRLQAFGASEPQRCGPWEMGLFFTSAAETSDCQWRRKNEGELAAPISSGWGH